MYDAPVTTNTIESRFLTTIDDVDRARWHHHRSSNIYGYGNLPLEVYIGQSIDDPENVWLRLRIR